MSAEDLERARVFTVEDVARLAAGLSIGYSLRFFLCVAAARDSEKRSPTNAAEPSTSSAAFDETAFDETAFE